MGRVEFTRKHFEAARDFLKHALQTDSPSREAHYYLGLVYARLGQTRQSMDELAIARKLELQELDQQRVLYQLVDTTEAGGPAKPNLESPSASAPARELGSWTWNIQNSCSATMLSLSFKDRPTLCVARP